MADPWAEFGQAPPALQALSNLRRNGAVVTNGYRTDDDYFRLKRQGYTPARNGAHPQGNGVDLAPGGQYRTLADLQRAAASQFGPHATVQIHNGTHVHVADPDFRGDAPDVTRGRDDPWSEFKPAPRSLNTPPPPAAPKTTLGQLAASTALSPLSVTGQAHDGDTMHLSNGRNGRLFGFDAFELGQQGRKADGSLVPLGQMARSSLMDALNGASRVNPTGEQTYGRPVVTLGDLSNDPARLALRKGLGTAEPQYLKGSPLFGPYMEAERLARLNRMGGFQTNAETPSQFRHKDGPWQGAEPGKYGDNAEAVFFDDRTPYGLRSEIAQAYNEFSRTAKSAEDLVQFGKDNGFEVPLEQAQKFIADRAKAGGRVGQGVEYIKPPRPMTDPGDGAIGSFARGFGDPFNALDEMGGVVDAVGLTPGRENIWNSDRRFGDVLWNNIDQNRAILDHDSDAHPYARMGGQLTSGLALPMGAASTPIRLAGLMGTEGAVAGLMAGEGDLKSRLPNAAAGAVLGTAAGGTLGLAGEHLVSPAVKRAIDFWRARRGVSGDAGAIAADVADEAMPVFNDGFQNAGPTPAARSQPQGGVFDERTRYANLDAEPSPEVSAPVQRVRDYLDLSGKRDPWAEFQPARVPDTGAIEPGAILTPADNSVSTLDEALKANPSRFQDVPYPNPSEALPQYTIRGGDLFKSTKRRDVYDVTKFIRANGGIRDDGGELAHLGIDNKPRADLPFGKNEQFLGRLVNNESGMSLDEAGEMLWEAGYFHVRPTTSELLDVLHGEQLGDYRYHPSDLDAVEEFQHRQAVAGAMHEAEAAGSPYAQDNSQAVNLDDLLKRTAPAYAYSEVPKAKIGNLNVTKIEGSDDLARAMQQIEDALGDHPAQATVTNEQTKAAAHELGMSVQDFLRTQPGQFDAKRIIAGRTLLHGALEATRRAAIKVVNGGTAEDKLAFERAKFVTALIQDHMKGATAEIGRTLQALKIVSTKKDARLAAIREAIRARGGHDQIEDSASEFLNFVGDPAKANRFIADNTKASALQMFNEAVTIARLSNPVTHARNFLGNAISTTVSLPETAVEAGIGKVRSLASYARGAGEVDRSYMAEVPARISAMAGAVPDAIKNMVKVFRTGEPIDGVSKVEANLHFRAIPGKAGEIIRIPGRAMTAADEAWKTLIYADHISALATREAKRQGLTGAARDALAKRLRNNPTDEMLNSAHVEARYRTFQQDLGKWGNSLQKFSNSFPGAKILLTFVRTPINLVKFAGERSMFGVAMPSVIRKLRAGGRERDEALSRIIVGSTISTAAVSAALNGHVSGSGPDDYRQKAALMATGWRPNSIRVGDKWVSYQGLDPVSTLVAVAADFSEAGRWATPEERKSIALNLTLSAAESASNRTWMGGVADFFEALSDPKRNAPAFLRSQAAGLVPAGVMQAEGLSDPYIRDAKTTLDAIKARVPVLSKSVPVRRDIWGEPLTRDSALGPDLVSPFRYGKMSSDPLTREVARLNVRLTPAERKFKDEEGNRVQLSAEQYDRFVQFAGQPARKALLAEVTSPRWRSMSDDEKRETIREIVSDFRSAARDQLRDELGGKNTSSPLPSSQAQDPWAEFKPASEAMQR